jgi:hypothetical protein
MSGGDDRSSRRLCYNGASGISHFTALASGIMELGFVVLADRQLGQRS